MSASAQKSYFLALENCWHLFSKHIFMKGYELRGVKKNLLLLLFPLILACDLSFCR